MINHNERFIFIHPEKCAGTSLRIILRRNFRETNIENEHAGHLGINKISTWANMPLDKYFKFGVVRNTWDRVVSFYYHCVTHRDLQGSFENFVLNYSELHLPFFNMRSKFTIRGQYMMDFVVRFENYHEDFSFIMDRLGIKNFDIPHENHATVRKNADYRSMYSQRTIDKVSELFQWEINQFGYKFGD